MAAVVFPTTLPVPDPGAVKPMERRLVSALPGLQQVRQIQADYLATQEVSWLFTAAEAAIMYTWWMVTLLQGGLWFSADWPLPAGWAVAVRRFIGPIIWEHVPGGNWRVRGLTEIRGAGLPPETDSETLYYTSWPYPIYVTDEVNSDHAIPQSGYFWYPPNDGVNADHAIPQSGTLATILQSYDSPPEELNADHAIPQNGTLDTVLQVYDSPPEELNADHAIPVTGTLAVVLVTYSNPPDELNADHAIPISGTLV